MVGPDDRARLKSHGTAIIASTLETIMTAPTNTLAVNPADETIDFGTMAVHFLVTGERSNGSVATFELTVLAGQRLMAPAHSHDHYEETIYGVDGVLTWTVNGVAIEVGPGQALCIPRGAVHRFDNLGGVDAKALCVIHACGHRPAILPRRARGGDGCRWWSAGSCADDGGDAAPRPHAGSPPPQAN
jgi:quercetin dioxygenase-like cupin family protein